MHQHGGDTVIEGYVNIQAAVSSVSDIGGMNVHKGLGHRHVTLHPPQPIRGLRSVVSRLHFGLK